MSDKLPSSSSSAVIMPLIGLYAATASLIWMALVTADIVHAIRYRKPWFPCKYSALNAASLTVIAVAVKLAMDISTKMDGNVDKLAKISSSVLLYASMTHMMPSLGSMNDRDKLVNMAALGILVLTLSVNVIFQLSTKENKFILDFLVNWIPVPLNTYSFFVLSSSALTVSTNKTYLEHKYNKLRARILSEDLQGNGQLFDFNKLKLHLNRYWVMAKTGSPQFVMARSEACYILALIANNYFILMMIASFLFRSVWYSIGEWETTSEYSWSVHVIFVTQMLAVHLCLLTSFVRFLHALLLNIRYFTKFLRSILSFDLHNYGIKRLIEWKKKSPPLQIRGQNRRKFIHLMRNLLLNICIGGQIVIVVTNKVLVLITFALTPGVILWYAITTALLVLPFLLPWIVLVVIMGRKKTGILRESDESLVDPNYTSEHDGLRNFALLLEGETIQDKYLKFIHKSINASIMMGARHNPRHLIELVEISTNFRGILHFQSDEVSPILIQKEPPNSWTSPIATLTSIMIGLPNIENHRKKQLLRSGVDGFKYMCLIEKRLDAEKKFASSRNAADFLWAGVELRQKWLDIHLDKLASQSKSYLGTLQTLARRSEEILKEFTNRDMIESPAMSYPSKVIAANSMYKISHTLMLDSAETTGPSLSDTHMFDKLSIMVADLFVACLTNLPRVILMTCYNSTIEQREHRVEEAASLFGETQGILRLIQKHKIPIILPPNQLVSIDEWRAFLLKHTNYDNATYLTSSENIASGDSMEIHAVKDHQLCLQISMDEPKTIACHTETNEEKRDPHERLEEGEDSSIDEQTEDGQV